MMEFYKLLINGTLTNSISTEFDISYDPGNGSEIAKFPKVNLQDADIAMESARICFDRGTWTNKKPKERAVYFYRLADLLIQNISRISRIEALDSGGLINRTTFDVMQSSRFIRRICNYASNEFSYREQLKRGPVMNPSSNYLVREPIGVCVSIIPWNYPLLMTIWKITMAVMMGNSIVIKPSNFTPLSALVLGELIIKARFPPGVINILPADSSIGRYLINHKYCDKISFTGNSLTGRSVIIDSADTFKRLTLELGGKSANIILEDANTELAADGALFAAFLHSGQICESGTRLFVHENKINEIIEIITKKTKEIKIGYQLDLKTKMGPVINYQRLKKIEEYVNIGMDEGAEVLIDGGIIKIDHFEAGYYYSPTIFINVKPEMRIFQEEIFGPVLCISTYKNTEEVIELANNSSYGLAAGIWTSDINYAEKIACKLKAGTVWINDWHIFHEFGPFGGFKSSGHGREFGKAGLESYCEIKHIHVGTNLDYTNKPGHRLIIQRHELPNTYEYHIPTKVVSGPDSIVRLRSEINDFDDACIMIITDSGVRKSGIVNKVEQIIGEKLVCIFDEIPPDTGIDVVNKALQIGKQKKINVIISLGGGSVIDTGKAVSYCLGTNQTAEEIIGINTLDGSRIPHYVIPTTAGSGSEATNTSVIMNKITNQKIYILDRVLYPDVAFLDPQVLISLSNEQILFSAMDIMTHSIEALTSIKANLQTNSNAFYSLELLSSNLLNFLNDRNDSKAANALQTSACLAGMAVSGAMVGLVHAMAHALGSIYGIPHGLANGLILPYVIEWNSGHEYCNSIYTQIFQRITPFHKFNEKRNLSENPLSNTIFNLLRSLNFPLTFKELNIENPDFENLSLYAFSDLAILTNMRKVTDSNEIKEIFLKAQ